MLPPRVRLEYARLSVRTWCAVLLVLCTVHTAWAEVHVRVQGLPTSDTGDFVPLQAALPITHYSILQPAPYTSLTAIATRNAVYAVSSVDLASAKPQISEVFPLPSAYHAMDVGLFFFDEDRTPHALFGFASAPALLHIAHHDGSVWHEDGTLDLCTGHGGDAFGTQALDRCNGHGWEWDGKPWTAASASGLVDLASDHARYFLLASGTAQVSIRVSPKGTVDVGGFAVLNADYALADHMTTLDVGATTIGSGLDGSLALWSLRACADAPEAAAAQLYMHVGVPGEVAVRTSYYDVPPRKLVGGWATDLLWLLWTFGADDAGRARVGEWYVDSSGSGSVATGDITNVRGDMLRAGVEGPLGSSAALFFSSSPSATVGSRVHFVVADHAMSDGLDTSHSADLDGVALTGESVRMNCGLYDIGVSMSMCSLVGGRDAEGNAILAVAWVEKHSSEDAGGNGETAVRNGGVLMPRDTDTCLADEGCTCPDSSGTNPCGPTQCCAILGDNCYLTPKSSAFNCCSLPPFTGMTQVETPPCP